MRTISSARGVRSSIRIHAGWKRILPLLRLEYYGREGRERIEVRSDISEDDRSYLVNVRCRCPKCGNVIHPFRQRKGSKSTLYFAASCKLSDSYPCSRSHQATEEYRKVVEEVQANHA